ncbi:MAG: hypothetical protein LLG06_07560, partial [Desulfobacteraceae bacterium]|nr:hypothetical protein [Desulfobacteraceae bacterium]
MPQAEDKFRNMHICIVTTEYSPGPGGGVATYNAIIARLLAQAGHKVSVVLKDGGDGALAQVENEGGIRIFKVGITVDPPLCRTSDEYLFVNEMRHGRHSVGIFARRV